MKTACQVVVLSRTLGCNTLSSRYNPYCLICTDIQWFPILLFLLNLLLSVNKVKKFRKLDLSLCGVFRNIFRRSLFLLQSAVFWSHSRWLLYFTLISYPKNQALLLFVQYSWLFWGVLLFFSDACGTPKEECLFIYSKFCTISVEWVLLTRLLVHKEEFPVSSLKWALVDYLIW